MPYQVALMTQATLVAAPGPPDRKKLAKPCLMSCSNCSPGGSRGPSNDLAATGPPEREGDGDHDFAGGPGRVAAEDAGAAGEGPPRDRAPQRGPLPAQ